MSKVIRTGLIFFCAVILLSSCNKKESSGEAASPNVASASVQQNGAKTEANAAAKAEKNATAKTPEKPSVSSVAQTNAPKTEAKVVAQETTETAVAAVAAEKSKVEAPAAEPAKGESAKAEPAKVVEAAPAEEALFAQKYVYGPYTGEVKAYADHAVLSCDAPLTVADVQYVAGLLVDAYPEAQYVTYELKDGGLVAYYPTCDAAFLNAVAVQLQSDANWLLAQLAAPAKEEAPVATASTTAPNNDSAKADASSSKIDETSSVKSENKETVVENNVETNNEKSEKLIVSVVEPEASEEPITAAGKKIRQSILLSGNISANLTPVVDISLNGAYEYQVSSYFSVGLQTGFSVTRKLPFETYLKFNYKNVYTKFGAGFLYDFADNEGKIIGDAGIGIEIPMEDIFSVFVEGGARVYYKNECEVRGYMSIGGKIKF